MILWGIGYWCSVKLRRFLGFYAFSPWHSQTCINNVTRPNLRTILEGDNHSYVAIFGGDQTQKPHLETRSNLSKLSGFLNLRAKTFTKNTSWLFPISQWQGCTDFIYALNCTGLCTIHTHLCAVGGLVANAFCTKSSFFGFIHPAAIFWILNQGRERTELIRWFDEFKPIWMYPRNPIISD